VGQHKPSVPHPSRSFIARWVGEHIPNPVTTQTPLRHRRPASDQRAARRTQCLHPKAPSWHP